VISSITGPAVAAFQPLLDRLGPAGAFDLRKLAPLWLSYPDTHVIDPAHLDALAWQFDCDIWGMTQAEAVASIRGVIALHRRGGTPWAVRRQLEQMGFSSVGIVEGSTRPIRYDGTWTFDGSETYGGDIREWAVFAVALIGSKGFYGARVLRGIDRAKSARAKLGSLQAILTYPILLTDQPVSALLTATDGDHSVSYSASEYTIEVPVTPYFDDRVVTGLKVLNATSQVVGELEFPAEIRRQGCSVTIRLTTNITMMESAAFDDSAAAFDDSQTNIDE
jgi:hypothetical protein